MAVTIITHHDLRDDTWPARVALVSASEADANQRKPRKRYLARPLAMPSLSREAVAQIPSK
jgi:hypothetical protein